MSNREPKFLGGLFLRDVHCYEAVDLLGGMKPLGCSKMGEIERTWSGHSGQHNGFAEIQSEIAQKEERHIVLRAFNGAFVLLRFEMTTPRQTHQIPPGLENQKDARQQLRCSRFFGQPFRSFLA